MYMPKVPKWFGLWPVQPRRRLREVPDRDHDEESAGKTVSIGVVDVHRRFL
jgi:hypothetical protein